MEPTDARSIAYARYGERRNRAGEAMVEHLERVAASVHGEARTVAHLPMSAMRPQRYRSSHSGSVPVDAPRRPVLFVNPRSGGGKAARARLADIAREREIESVELAGGCDLDALIAGALAGGADALGVAGGDGSLAQVASAASAHGIPFVVVPTGTRNHFARDVGVAPNDPVAALDAFGTAFERRIDLGDVNGRLFLNNVSLGIYGDAVRRATYRDAKVRTLLEAAGDVLGPSAAVSDLHLVDDAGRKHARPAVVLVSNNPYAFERPPVRGARPVLDSGQLGVMAIDPAAGPPRLVQAWTAESLRVDASENIAAGVDGEAVVLAPPLDFTIHPRCLRVRIAPRRVEA